MASRTAVRRGICKETEAESPPSFEAFCAEARLEQRRLHLPAPTKDSQSFAYFQWLHAAAVAFATKYHLERLSEMPDEPTRSVGHKRQRADAVPASPSMAPLALEDPLVGVTAALLLYTLADASHGTAAMRRARDEAFPMPRASTADAEALLAMSELTIRMSLACPTESNLTPAVRKVRGLMKLFIERGVVSRERRGYPGIAFLMDLLSLRMIVASWDQLDTAARGYVVNEMERFSGRIHCPAVRALEGELASMRATGRGLDAAKVNQLIAELAAQVPYDFPQVCHDALCDALRQHSLPIPSGHLVFLSDDDEDDGIETEDDEMDTGAMALAVNQRGLPTKSKRRASSTTSPAGQSQSKSATAGHATHPAPSAAAAPRQPPQASRGGSARPCTSKYHSRYANASAHAGKLCQFCVVCHMLEILFNGCLTDCTYNHWPTAGKIRYNLRAHPHVKQLALARLEKSERGESLKEGLRIPL